MNGRSHNKALVAGFVAIAVVVPLYVVLLGRLGLMWDGETFGGPRFVWLDSVSVAVGFVAFFAGFLLVIMHGRRK